MCEKRSFCESRWRRFMLATYIQTLLKRFCLKSFLQPDRYCQFVYAVTWWPDVRWGMLTWIFNNQPMVSKKKHNLNMFNGSMLMRTLFLSPPRGVITGYWCYRGPPNDFFNVCYCKFDINHLESALSLPLPKHHMIKGRSC